jgi:hypothetical protein
MNYNILILLIILILLYSFKSKLYIRYITYKPAKIKIDGVYVDSKYINELYQSDGSIIFFSKIQNDYNIVNFIQLNNLKAKYPNIIINFDYKYTNDLTVKNNELIGNYLVIFYKILQEYTFIENMINMTDIELIVNSIIDLTIKTNNEILFDDYKMNTITKNLYIYKFSPNTLKCDSKIYNICSLIEIILKNHLIFVNKKELYYIIGVLSNLIDNMEDKFIDKLESYKNYNSINIINNELIKNHFFKKIKLNENNYLKKPPINHINKLNKYDIKGYNVSDKTIEEIKKIVNSDIKIPQINKNLLDKNIIGEGLFSNVYKNGDRVIKIYKDKYLYHKENSIEIESSIKINNIKNYNKYFPKFYGANLIKNNDKTLLYLEYDYIEGNTISDFLKMEKNINNNSILKIINNYFHGNNYLNKHGIKRNDNHGNNIMIEKNYNIKYIDYGKTYIVKNTDNKQLDMLSFFSNILQTIISILNYNLTKKKFILNILIKEFVTKLGSI